MRRFLVVVPTAGNKRGQDGRIVPSSTGRLRLHKAVETAKFLSSDLSAHPQIDLIVLGGCRKDSKKSEAEVLLGWGERQFALAHIFLKKVALARAKYTVRDTLFLSDWMIAEEQSGQGYYNSVFFICHPRQGALAEAALRSCGFQGEIKIIHSNEPSPYPDWIYWYLLLLAKIDPLWKGLLSRPLVWLANRRGHNE